MAHLLNAEGVTVAFAARTLLDGVSLGVDDGDRIGVVGRNGDGKTTLVSIIAGLAPPASGRGAPAGGLRVAMLAQEDQLDPAATVRQTVLGEVPEHVWASDARSRG